MATRYVIFFAVALLVIGGAHYYVWARLVRDAGLPSPWGRIATAAVALLFALLMSVFIAVRALSRGTAAPLTWVAYTWLGALFFLVISLGVSDLVKVIAVRDRGGPDDPERRQALARIFGGAAALVGIGASGVGLASALSPVAVSRVRVAIDRLGKAQAGYRIVQISDVHVGPTIGRSFIEDIVARINALQPDLVAITGDLVDGSVQQLAEHVAPLAKLRAKDGVFFVTGNHEYYSGADSWIAHLGTLGIRVLRNEHVRIGGEDGFDLAGIDDASSHGHGHGPDLAKALRGRDADRACVLLPHTARDRARRYARRRSTALGSHARRSDDPVEFPGPSPAALRRRSPQAGARADLRQPRDRVLGPADARRRARRDHGDRARLRLGI